MKTCEDEHDELCDDLVNLAKYIRKHPHLEPAQRESMMKAFMAGLDQEEKLFDRIEDVRFEEAKKSWPK